MPNLASTGASLGANCALHGINSTDVNGREDAALNEIGFIGLGVMGLPMARNLAAAGARLRVWNRSPEKYRALEASNVTPAATAGEVLRAVEVTIIMLVNSEAIDEVLGRGTSDFARNIRGRTIVSMSSVSPDYSCALARDIGDAGGHYVEAPVSGSRKPAEDAQLVCMAGGDPADIARVSPMLRHMCREVIDCGPVGNALRMKLAVNLYLNTMLAGLAEAVHFASENRLPLEKFQLGDRCRPAGQRPDPRQAAQADPARFLRAGCGERCLRQHPAHRRRGPEGGDGDPVAGPEQHTLRPGSSNSAIPARTWRVS